MSKSQGFRKLFCVCWKEYYNKAQLFFTNNTAVREISTARRTARRIARYEKLAWIKYFSEQNGMDKSYTNHFIAILLSRKNSNNSLRVECLHPSPPLDTYTKYCSWARLAVTDFLCSQDTKCMFTNKLQYISTTWKLNVSSPLLWHLILHQQQMQSKRK